MNIYNYEKLTLVDYDDHLAAIVFVGACNFKCPFCHNGPLVKNLLRQVPVAKQDFFDYLVKRKNLLNGVVVSGGEPTLYGEELVEFISEIKKLDYEVKLDTNGTNPELVKYLIDNKLIDFVAMDIKSDKDTYNIVAGVEHLDISKIEQSVNLLLEGKIDYEFRTTIIKEYHSKEIIENIASWISGAKKYALQKYKDNENCLEHGFHPFTEQEAQELEQILLSKGIQKVFLRGY